MKESTKKAQKAAMVAENKRQAFVKAVNRLIRHVAWIGERVPMSDVYQAYTDGKTAEAYSAEIASREPVGMVVHPLKVEAVCKAREYSEAQIEAVRTELEAAEWDRNLIASYIRSPKTYEEHLKRAAFDRIDRFVKSADGNNQRWDEPVRQFLVVMDAARCKRYIEQNEHDAAYNYDAFIVKLVRKVGEVTAAELDGSHVWAHSILTVVLPNGERQRWKTQQIENVSKLGLYFPQWPTRLMKD